MAVVITRPRCLYEILATRQDAMSDDASAAQLLQFTAQIVAAHVVGNSIDSAELPALIRSVHDALRRAGTAVEVSARREPAVPAKRSVFPDYIICLEDGKKLKTLKRHLATSFQLTPEQYRERWDLPRDYPMVAPNYAKQRSKLARQFGLGRRRAEPLSTPEPTQKAGKKPGRTVTTA